MRLVITLLVRDEADVLALALDGHLALGVDHVVAMDNGSTDGTRELLEDYARRGALTLLESDDSVFDQARYTTRMARHAATELGADWVLNVDADELWWPLAGTLPDVLGAVPDRYGILVVPRHDFLPVAGEEPPEPWRRMTVRASATRSPRGTRLVPKVAHRAHPEVEVGFGNHRASAPGLAWAPLLTVAEVLHYPIRSYDQLARKVTAIAGRRSDDARAPGMAADALLLAELLERGELRGWYERQCVTAKRLEQGLCDGGLVRDERVLRFAEQGIERRPADLGVQAELREAFEVLDAWAGEHRGAGHEELTARVGELESERGELLERITELEALRDTLDEQLRAERAEHYTTAESLRMLRDSRMQRAAAAARRMKPR